jgi:hypothetical protein
MKFKPEDVTIMFEVGGKKMKVEGFCDMPEIDYKSDGEIYEAVSRWHNHELHMKIDLWLEEIKNKKSKLRPKKAWYQKERW